MLFSPGAIAREDVDNHARNAKAAGGIVFAEPYNNNNEMG
jgi:hypothetical protein